MDELRALFLPRFLATARERLAACARFLDDGAAGRLASELHALAGEASILGCEPLAGQAREAEAVARAWSSAEGQADGLRQRLTTLGRELAVLERQAPGGGVGDG